MGLFDFAKVCLFSRVNGIVTLSGKAAPGAEVIRTAEFRNKRYVDKAVTDNEGRYRFPESSEHSFSKILYLEPRISQSILIRYQGTEYVAWESVKGNYAVDGEISEPLSLACELTTKSKIKRGRNGNPVNGICSWQFSRRGAVCQ